MSEDTTITDRARYSKAYRGWLSYAFASEVFAVVCLGMFLPICLEQLAQDNGYLLPGKIEPCSSQKQPQSEEERCVVKVGWFWVDSASFSLYINSISVALQALVVISMGGIANYPPYRKRALLIFAAAGSIATALFLAIPSSSGVWMLTALLAILGNIGFGASTVALNAYIPSLARQYASSSKDWLNLKANANGTESSETLPSDVVAASYDVEDSLLPRQELEESSDLKLKYDTLISNATSSISSSGIALGYSAGISVLLLTLIPVTQLKGTTFSLRLAIGLTGIWWAVFSLPAALWLPSKDPTIEHQWRGKWKFRSEVWRAWRQLGLMLRWREISKLKNTFLYLGAWFLLSDGFSSISSTAILFGKTTLHMPPTSLILIGVIAPGCGIIGSLVWPIVQQCIGWSNKKVILIQLILMSLIPLYGCLGFLSFFKGIGFGGLTSPAEMFVLAAVYGLIHGAFQGYARAFYAELIPPGEEARWYGLFSITDKSSAFVGPLTVGIIADATGNIRYAFFFLVIMVWLALPFLASIDVMKGRQDAQNYHFDE